MSTVPRASSGLVHGFRRSSCWSDGALPCWLSQDPDGHAFLADAMWDLAGEAQRASKACLRAEKDGPWRLDACGFDDTGVETPSSRECLQAVAEIMQSLARNSIFPSCGWIVISCELDCGTGIMRVFAMHGGCAPEEVVIPMARRP